MYDRGSYDTTDRRPKTAEAGTNITYFGLYIPGIQWVQTEEGEVGMVIFRLPRSRTHACTHPWSACHVAPPVLQLYGFTLFETERRTKHVHALCMDGRCIVSGSSILKNISTPQKHNNEQQGGTRSETEPDFQRTQ